LPTLWDKKVFGLRIRIGRKRHAWSFYRERRFRGKRKYIFRRLGFFPIMGVADARKAALALAAQVSETHFDPGSRKAVRLDAALDAYVRYLREHKTGKSAINAASLSRLYLLPDFGALTLRELSDSPQLIHDWHKRVARHSAVSANNSARLLRACYRRAARLDRTLPAALPTSAVEMIPEHAAQSGMPFDRFPAWRVQVEALPPLHAAYHRLMLLTGMRGDSARRLQWNDVNVKARTLTLRGAPGRKVRADVSIPMTSAIAAALKLARPARDGVMFPGAIKWKDRLAFKGHALRHTYIAVAHDIEVSEIFVRLLVVHSLRGVHESYLTRAVMEGGEGLKGAQRRISRKIVELLGGG
jgi:integrase